MAHIAATGQNGLILFQNEGKWVFLATTKINRKLCLTLIKDLKPIFRIPLIFLCITSKDIYLGIE